MKDYEKLALNFGRHIVKQEWESAHSLLSAELQSTTSPEDIEHEVRNMIAYAKDKISDAEIVLEMEEWPDKKDDDIGWVYVSLFGSTFSEAVSVVVEKQNLNLAIRSLEWGRP